MLGGSLLQTVGLDLGSPGWRGHLRQQWQGFSFVRWLFTSSKSWELLNVHQTLRLDNLLLRLLGESEGEIKLGWVGRFDRSEGIRSDRHGSTREDFSLHFDGAEAALSDR